MLTIQHLIDDAKCNATGLPDGRYVPSRPIQFNATRPGNQPLIDRIRDAWEVITGRADAVKWEGQ